MLLAAGELLGPYEILEPIGSGGMGEVYRARDRRLGRDVAIKLVREDLVGDAQGLRRFQQEAKAAAAFHHPNICVLHEIGESGGHHYIVMEFVEGKPLSRLIGGRPLPAAQIVDLATQMADALEEARSKGVVHRDIKPANIVVTPKGQAKILDFGLAKTALALKPDDETQTAAGSMTQSGLVLGTVPYMSPEQALGEPADHRSDLFSLGIVLYEMATGKRPFEGATTMALLNEIINKTPTPPSTLNPELPLGLEPILRKMLEKNRELRYQTAGDLGADLKRLRDPAPAPRRASRAIPMLVVGAAAAAAVWAGFFRDAGRGPAEQPSILPFTTFSGSEITPSFSPDGKQLAYAWDGEKNEGYRIYVQRLDSATPLRVTNGPGGNDSNPVWSPDGGQIAFLRVSGAGAGVYLIPSLGGPERRLTETSPPSFAPAARTSVFLYKLAWSPDGKTLAIAEPKAGTTEYGAIQLLTIATGERRALTTAPSQSNSDRSPAFSPDGGRIAFVRQLDYFVDDIYVVPVAGGETTRLTTDRRSAETPVWTPDGSAILFQSNRAVSPAIWKVPAGGGKPERVAGVSGQISGLALSRQGDRLAYVQSVNDYNIWRAETKPAHNNRPERWIASTRLDTSPQYSPDGKRIAFASDRSGSFEIWVCDSDGANPAQLTTFGRGSVGSPAWSPDGRRIAFDARPERSPDIHVVNADGGPPVRITNEPSQEVVPSWSSDGQWIYFHSDRGGAAKIWKIRVGPHGAIGEAAPVTKKNGWISRESPDGRFLYFTLRDAAGLWRIPAGGGDEIRILDGVTTYNRRLWAVVEKGIYFAYGDDVLRPLIGFHDFATGRITSVAAPEKPLTAGYGSITVSPDGRFLLYPQIDQSGSDIVLLEHFR